MYFLEYNLFIYNIHNTYNIFDVYLVVFGSLIFIFIFILIGFICLFVSDDSSNGCSNSSSDDSGSFNGDDNDKDKDKDKFCSESFIKKYKWYILGFVVIAGISAVGIYFYYYGGDHGSPPSIPNIQSSLNNARESSGVIHNSNSNINSSKTEVDMNEVFSIINSTKEGVFRQSSIKLNEYYISIITYFEKLDFNSEDSFYKIEKIFSNFGVDLNEGLRNNNYNSCYDQMVQNVLKELTIYSGLPLDSEPESEQFRQAVLTEDHVFFLRFFIRASMVHYRKVFESRP